LDLIERVNSLLPDRSDILLAAGIVSLYHGACLIYLPAGYIVAGIAFISLAIIQARK
jgi:hypothetical protein